MKDGQIPSWEDIETHDTQMRISRAASSTTVKSGSSTVTQEDEELGKLRDGTRTKLQLVRRCCDSCLAPATRLGCPVRLPRVCITRITVRGKRSQPLSSSR